MLVEQSSGCNDNSTIFSLNSYIGPRVSQEPRLYPGNIVYNIDGLNRIIFNNSFFNSILYRHRQTRSSPNNGVTNNTCINLRKKS